MTDPNDLKALDKLFKGLCECDKFKLPSYGMAKRLHIDECPIPTLYGLKPKILTLIQNAKIDELKRCIKLSAKGNRELTGRERIKNRIRYLEALKSTGGGDDSQRTI